MFTVAEGVDMFVDIVVQTTDVDGVESSCVLTTEPLSATAGK